MTLRLARWFALVGCAWLATASPAAAETPSEQAAALLDGLIQTNDPGLAVLVARDGKIIFEKSCGLSDREHHLPVSPQTTFCIGSVTKQFTAAAILKLQQEGKLSVDDKLSKYVPDFPRANEVTLRHLLTHTSGIHNYNEDAAFFDRLTNDTTAAVVEAMKKEPYDFDPGTKWSYANSGYMLLGYIVEKVSGQTYGDFLRANFFQPLGMTNTGVYRTNSVLPHAALGYSLGTNGFAPAEFWDPSWYGGAGALYSTVEDLYRWNEGVFNSRVLNTASLKAAFAPVKTTEKPVNADAGYGFGWIVNRDSGFLEIWHNGGVPGFKSCLLRLPDDKFTVVVLANGQPGPPDTDPDRVARQLLGIFLASRLAPLTAVNTNVSPESYDALTGRYQLQGTIATVSRRDTHLFGRVANLPEAELFPRSETEFFSRRGVQVTFVKDNTGRAAKLIVHEYGLDLEAPRAKEYVEAKVDPAIYDRLAGQYDYGNGAVMTVTREGDHLFAQLTGQSKCEIFPQSETDYFWKAVDAQVTFVKDPTGKVVRAIHHQNRQTIDAPKIE